jgi:hypothetical protein
MSEKTLFLSHQVRLGKISREEAMKQELQLIRDRAPPPSLAPFLKEIGMNEQEFTEAVRDWRKNQKYQGKWEQFLASLISRLK